MTAYTTPTSFPARDLQREAEREVAMRKRVYDKSAMSDLRIARMAAIAEHFKQIADAEDAKGRLPL